MSCSASQTTRSGLVTPTSQFLSMECLTSLYLSAYTTAANGLPLTLPFRGISPRFGDERSGRRAALYGWRMDWESVPVMCPRFGWRRPPFRKVKADALWMRCGWPPTRAVRLFSAWLIQSAQSVYPAFRGAAGNQGTLPIAACNSRSVIGRGC